ncbi:IS110 family transposase [Idiomarina sp.]|jgi:transposase|uniref:IS110 family transposase n=1 Tax=Idiomarina sp. TaxID=1874361 RepID=UPI0025C1E2E7|nr:IS110 family transposase [Idiomarina sp.]
MAIVNRIALDLAKDFIQVLALDESEQEVFNKKLRSNKVLAKLATLKRTDDCEVAVESCGMSHHWRREIEKLGYKTVALPPRFVKAYLQGEKNDANDARAIAEAASRPNRKSVRIKSIEQQDLALMVSQRDSRVQTRTQEANRLRSVLAEYGITMPQRISSILKRVPEILEDADNALTARSRDLVLRQYELLRIMDEEVKAMDKLLSAEANNTDDSRRLMTIPGIGPVTAVSLLALIGDVSDFKRGRNVSEYLGLVPRQNSSGGKDRLGGITKKGNTRLRTLLVHGARSALRMAHKRNDKLSLWAQDVAKRRGNNIAAVALANKHARIIWAMLTHKEDYRMAAA